MTAIDDVLGRTYRMADGTAFTVTGWDGGNTFRCRTADGSRADLAVNAFYGGLDAGAIVPAMLVRTRGGYATC